MSKNLLIFFFLFPFVLIGQDLEKWQLGVQLRPIMSGVTSYQSDYSSQPNFCFSGYAGALYTINSNITFNTGLGFGWNKYSRTQSNLIFEWDIDPEAGVISSSVLDENFTTRSIEIPAIFNFKLFNNLYAVGGVQANLRQVIGIDRTIRSSAGKYEELILKDANPAFTASVVIGLGYQFELTEKINIHAEPLFRWNLTDPIMTAGNLYESALQIGCFVRL